MINRLLSNFHKRQENVILRDCRNLHLKQVLKRWLASNRHQLPIPLEKQLIQTQKTTSHSKFPNGPLYHLNRWDCLKSLSLMLTAFTVLVRQWKNIHNHLLTSRQWRSQSLVTLKHQCRCTKQSIKRRVLIFVKVNIPNRKFDNLMEIQIHDRIKFMWLLLAILTTISTSLIKHTISILTEDPSRTGWKSL